MVESFEYLGDEFEQRIEGSKVISHSIARWLLEAVNSRSKELYAKVIAVLDSSKTEEQIKMNFSLQR